MSDKESQVSLVSRRSLPIRISLSLLYRNKQTISKNVTTASFATTNEAIKDSKLRPRVHNALFAGTAKLHCVQQGLRPRDVSRREAKQRGEKLKHWRLTTLSCQPHSTRHMRCPMWKH